jgi:hypothetical protein
MRPLIVFAAIVLFLMSPSCKWLRHKGLIGRGSDTMIVWIAKQDSIRVADSIAKVQYQLTAENRRLDSIKLVEKEKMEWESSHKYTIIVGSFIVPENAKNFSALYASKGYKTRILKLEGTQFEMVCAEAHSSFKTAVERLKQFQDTVEYDAWMYVIK